MGFVRDLEEGDLSRVAKLYQKMNGGRYSGSHGALESYFRDIFFDNPWNQESISSLVYEEKNEGVVGFLGVIPRRMCFQGSIIKVAVGNNFMVDPEFRTSMAGIQLLKKFFAGPQDLSLTDEANELVRRAWEGCGGVASQLYSMHWRRPLRPTQYLMRTLMDSGFLKAVHRLTRPICYMLDSLFVRVQGSPFYLSEPALQYEELDEISLQECITHFAADRLLFPVYDANSLGWLLDMLAQKQSYGSLHKALIRDEENKILGWYLYLLKPGENAQVVQVGGSSQTIKEVLECLIFDAWRNGALALNGRLDPRFMQTFSELYCFFDQSASGTLIQSKNSGIIQAFLQGDAFFTRLEGEWWLRTREVLNGYDSFSVSRRKR